MMDDPEKTKWINAFLEQLRQGKGGIDPEELARSAAVLEKGGFPEEGRKVLCAALELEWWNEGAFEKIGSLLAQIKAADLIKEDIRFFFEISRFSLGLLRVLPDVLINPLALQNIEDEMARIIKNYLSEDEIQDVSKEAQQRIENTVKRSTHQNPNKGKA